MRFAQLRAFHHVALCGGFSRAAERLHLTQPAVSDQIRKLEAEYDVLLFDRSGKRTALTAKGRQLFDHTNRLFAAEAGAREFLTETLAELSGNLRLMVDSAIHVAGILSEFQRDNPKVGIRLKSGNTEAVIRSLLDYEAEIGVGGDFPESARLEEMSLGTSPVVAIVAKNHRLASSETATFGELAKFPLLLRESGSKTRQIVEAAAEDLGVDLKGAVEAEGREAVHDLAAAGTGIGFVSKIEIPHGSELATIGIEDQQFLMEEKLVHLRQRRDAPMVRSFMESAARWKRRQAGGRHS